MMTPDDFRHWLRAVGAEDRFMASYRRDPRRRLSLASYLRRTPEAYWIRCAFVWHDTREGNRYWHDIDRQLQKRLACGGREGTETDKQT